MTALDIPFTGMERARTDAEGTASLSIPSAPAVEQLIVPLDGSAVAERALGVAADFASALGAGVRILCVAANESQAADLREYLIALGSRMGIGPTSHHIEAASDPAATIAAAARAAPGSVVCMSSHGHGMLTSALLGSVSTTVLASTGDMVLLVGPKANLGPHEAPVVACVDGSKSSLQALPHATGWAAKLGVGVTVVTVAEPVPASTGPGELRYRRRFGPNIDLERYLADVAARNGEQDSPIATHAIYNPLGPADGLVSYLADQPARMVVLATRARGGAPHPYLSRATADIVRSCPVPVLVVGAPG